MAWGGEAAHVDTDLGDDHLRGGAANPRDLIQPVGRHELARGAQQPAPHGQQEFDEVFDAYFADSDLWVTILTGAGEQAFSAGNDLVYSASGKPMWVPKNGLPIWPAVGT
jgi:hypothetical protein